MKKKITKTEKVLKHLQTHKRGITSMTAFERYNLTRLSSVIFELKKRGYDIITIREHTKDGTSYGRYVLIDKEGA